MNFVKSLIVLSMTVGHIVIYAHIFEKARIYDDDYSFKITEFYNYPRGKSGQTLNDDLLNVNDSSTSINYTIDDKLNTESDVNEKFDSKLSAKSFVINPITDLKLLPTILEDENLEEQDDDSQDENLEEHDDETKNNERKMNEDKCQKKLKHFFSKCGDCETYLDIAKYILLYVVYDDQKDKSECVCKYINYVYKAIKKRNGIFDKYKVTNPQNFCYKICHPNWKNPRQDCLKEMTSYFKTDRLKNTDAAIKFIYFKTNIAKQVSSNSYYIRKYIMHVKNRFYYKKENLIPVESFHGFCLYHYEHIVYHSKTS